MATATWHTGDVRQLLAEMPDQSVDFICTSPPFLALRSYLPAGHPDKGKEIGSEPNPPEFLRTLIELTREFRRVLTPHGSIAIELGDTYSGSGGAGGDYTDTGLRAGQEKFSGSAIQHRRSALRNRKMGISARRDRAEIPHSDANGGPGWPLAKSLCMIPSLYAGSLAYGMNLLDHTDRLDPWRVRNLIAWVRPNPPVGALGDKVRPASSYITTACMAKDRWFDLDAERTPSSPNAHARIAKGATPRHDLPSQQRDGNWSTLAANNDANPAGAPLLDWWEITPGGYAGAHYAVYPMELPRRLINLMCPRQVCLECGQPRRRITETTNARGVGFAHWANPADQRADRNDRAHSGTANVVTLGWTDCGHGAWRNGITLDPFAGSGTTLAAATGLGRDAIGIDLDARNLHLARERVGMFLTEAPALEVTG